MERVLSSTGPGKGWCPMHSFFRFLILAAITVFLLGCNESKQSPPNGVAKQQSLPDQGEDKKKPAEEADAATIAKLINQLGNPNFVERKEATDALEAIGFPALGALRKAAKDNDAEVAQRATRLVEFIENSLDTLLADYRGYGLPLPPDDAKLVRFESV